MAGNCSACRCWVEPGEGWLYQGKLRTGKRTWNVKCDACHENKETPLTLQAKTTKRTTKRVTVNDVKRWLKGLQYKTVVVDDGSHYVEVCSSDGEPILGGGNPLPPFDQHYPTYDEIIEVLGADTITDKAFALAEVTIRREIEQRLYAVLVEQTAEVITRLAYQDTGFLAIQEIDAALSEAGGYSPIYNPGNLGHILIRLQVTHRIELKTTKSRLAENLGIKLYKIGGVNYGFVKKTNEDVVIADLESLLNH